MLFDSIQITEGGNISNLVVASGTTFPTIADQGELYFHTGDQLLYAYNGSQWVAFTSSVTQIPETQIADGSILARLATNDTVTGAWTFTDKVTGVDPTSAQHLATKAYVDTIASGLKPKSSVKVATTGPITLSTAQTIVDGFTLAEGNRVLVKNQLSWAENGVWVVTASGAWTRAHDFDNSADSLVMSGDFFYVEHGSQAGTAWVLITQDPVVGTTGMEFSQVISAANGVTYVAASGGTTGLTISGGPITTAGTFTLGGTLAVSNGGTGVTSLAAAQTAILPIQTSNSGKFLSTDGTTASWTTVNTGGTTTIGSTSVALNGSTVTLDGLTSVTATTFNGALNGNASSASVANMATTATTATNLAGGDGASIPYQTAAGSTAMLPFGTAGYVLTSNGSNAPSWTAISAGQAAAGTLSGSTLASNVVTSSLTSVGTISSGTWHGTAIANSYLANSSLTINGVAISLGGTGTITAAANTLTGTSLASGITSSSLTSVGTLSSLGVTGTVTAGAFSGPLTGNVTGNVSGTAASITGTYAGSITSAQITTGLGFTPYNATNPSGYLTASGTIANATTASTANALNTANDYSINKKITFAGAGANASIWASPDANWGYLYRPAQDGVAAAHGFLNAAGTAVVTIQGTGYLSAASGIAAAGQINSTSNSNGFYHNSNTTGSVGFASINASTVGYAHVQLGSNGQLKTLRCDASGNLQVVNTANTAVITTIDNSGNLTASGNIGAYSDERLKTNWQDLAPNFVEQLANVKVGTYDRLDNCAHQVGVSAQSLQAVLPEAVLTDPDGMLAVTYGNAALAACIMLAKEVQELKAKIAILEAK